jgi:hypothetical protein
MLPPSSGLKMKADFSAHRLKLSPLPKIKLWGCEKYPRLWFRVHVNMKVHSVDHHSHEHAITNNLPCGWSHLENGFYAFVEADKDQECYYRPYLVALDTNKHKL